MRKVLILSLLGLFILPLAGFTQTTGQDVEVSPMVISQGGAGAVYFFETRWPDFYEFIPHGGCPTLNRYSTKRKVKSMPAAKTDPITHPLYPDADPHDNHYDYFVDPAGGFEPSASQYTVIPGLAKTIDFRNLGLADYRGTAKMVVTWTVRLEGYHKAVQPSKTHGRPLPNFGQYCNGLSRQSFPKGKAYTRLFVNDEPMGEPAIMTIPYGGTGYAPPVADPTHTGEVILTPAMFGGQFPNQLKLKVKLYNDTASYLKCPVDADGKGMRNLIITITPIN